MRFDQTRRLAPLAALLFAAACSSYDLLPAAPDLVDAARAAASFDHIADSVQSSGGAANADLAASYGALAGAVRNGGRLSPVTITIDGVPTSFIATAQLTESSFSPCSGQICAALAPSVVRPVVTRSLIAWQKDDPRRVVQLTAAADSLKIGAQLFPSFAAPFVPTALLVYLDGKGGTWFGTSGTQKMTSAASEAPCTTLAGSRPVIAIVPSVRCTLAEFTIAFNGIAEPSRFIVANNTATGIHSLAMAAQPVSGVRLQYTTPPCSPSACLPGGGPLPPIDVKPTTMLPSTLTATQDASGTVTFTFTVTNTLASPANVGFATSQQVELVAADPATGAVVWSSSAAALFAQAMTSRTIAAGGSASFTESWKPAVKGTYTVSALLTSYTHRASARASVTVR